MPGVDGRSILLVAHLSPPSPLIAARRAAGMAKFLARLGHSVTVLTSIVSGTGSTEGAAEVIRTPDLMASRLNWRRRHFEALTGGGGVYSSTSRLQSVVVPDLTLVSWIPFALRAALALTRHTTFDCVITTSPPQSAHIVGDVLRRQRGVAWIAELRDGWTFQPPRPEWPLGPQRTLDRALERRLLRSADAIVGVTRPLVNDVAIRLGVEAYLITNGFDPDETGQRVDDQLLIAGKHSFVHTGRIGVAGTKLDPLLAALRSLGDKRDRLEVVFAGPLSEAEAEQLSAPDLAGVVRTVGALERPRALALQRAADTLLVLTEGARRTSVATGKLFEYLAAGRPILVLGDETEAARIVEETGSGWATSATDSGAIAGALRSAVSGGFRWAPDRRSVTRYSWPELAAEYAQLIEKVSRG